VTSPFTESIVEQAALAWLESTGRSVKSGAEIAPLVIDTAFSVEPRLPIELRWAYYDLLLRQDINNMDSGSAIPSTSREDFYSLPVLSPPLDLQQTFAQLLNPFWLRQMQGDQESRTLAALRDTLLPKLISGELRVNDAERFVKEHELT